MYKKVMNSPVGKIEIIEENEKLIELNIYNEERNEKKNNIIEEDTRLLLEVEKQLKEYFKGKRTKFEIPLNPKGTEFMKKVWKELLKIPYGETKTYKEIAEKIGDSKASRAVGMANNKNPIPIIIPCHRVIGSNNKLVGYALGLDIKQYLLDLERKVVS